MKKRTKNKILIGLAIVIALALIIILSSSNLKIGFGTFATWGDESKQEMDEATGLNCTPCGGVSFSSQLISPSSATYKCNQNSQCDAFNVNYASFYTWNSVFIQAVEIPSTDTSGWGSQMKCWECTGEPIPPEPECLAGETKCLGEIYYTCESGSWFEQGNVGGKCGYVAPVCINGEISGETCVGDTRQYNLCVNGQWLIQTENCLLGCQNGKCLTESPPECNIDSDCKSQENSCFVKCVNNQCENYNTADYELITNVKPCTQAEWMDYPDCSWDESSCIQPECFVSTECMEGWYCEENNNKCYECPSTYGGFAIIDYLMSFTYAVEDCGNSEPSSCVVNSECYEKFESENYCSKRVCVNNTCIVQEGIRYEGCCIGVADCDSGICENYLCKSSEGETFLPIEPSVQEPIEYEEIIETSKKSNKVPWSIILIVFGLIIFGVGGYFIFRKKGKWKK